MSIIYLRPNHDKRIKQGHLWVFSNELQGPLKSYTPGAIVDILDAYGRFLGRGYLNPHSLIAVRIITWNQEEIDEAFFWQRITSAWQYRQKIYPDRESLRVVYSEGDFLPGLIVDKYNDCLVVQFHTLGMEIRKDLILAALEAVFKPKIIVLRNDVPIRKLEGLPLEKKVEKGILSDPIIIKENGLRFQVDVLGGQKSGFFFDQYENRRELHQYVSQGQVLDCFCYTGAWALHAAAAGAQKVVGLDSSARALELARINAELNGFSDRCEFYRADIFEGIEYFVRNIPGFDTVILDPPALADGHKGLPVALKGYEKINYQAFKLLKPGGILITSSCSYHVDLELFRKVVLKAARKAGRIVRLLEYGYQSQDHPILLAVPETQYLKSLFLLVN
jgi:23S rRNA (cytosine1962-C5)-methyltransferase